MPSWGRLSCPGADRLVGVSDMKSRLVVGLALALLTGCTGGIHDALESGRSQGNWLTEYRFEKTYFRHHYCFAKANIGSESTFGVFEWIVELDEPLEILDGRSPSAFGMKVETRSGTERWTGAERLLITLQFSTGFKLERTFGRIDDRGVAHIDFGPDLKAHFLRQIDRAHSVEIVSEDGEVSGQVDLKGMSEALKWVDQCAIEHGARRHQETKKNSAQAPGSR